MTEIMSRVGKGRIGKLRREFGTIEMKERAESVMTEKREEKERDKIIIQNSRSAVF